MNSRASTNPPLPPNPNKSFQKLLSTNILLQINTFETHSIVTYLYSIQRLLHCNLSDIKEKMMHSYYSSIYNTTIFSIVKKNFSPHPHSNDDPPQLYVFFSHTTPFQFIMTPPPKLQS